MRVLRNRVGRGQMSEVPVLLTGTLKRARIEPMIQQSRLLCIICKLYQMERLCFWFYMYTYSNLHVHELIFLGRSLHWTNSESVCLTLTCFQLIHYERSSSSRLNKWAHISVRFIFIKAAFKPLDYSLSQHLINKADLYYLLSICMSEKEENDVGEQLYSLQNGHGYNEWRITTE
jgi:hypothetical protein